MRLRTALLVAALCMTLALMIGPRRSPRLDFALRTR